MSSGQIKEDEEFPQPNFDSVAFSPGTERKNWLSMGTKQPLLINSRPLGAFSPLGQPEPERQWTVVVALMVVAASQGFAAGALEVLAGRIIAQGYLGIPPTTVAKAGTFVRATSFFVFAPLGGWLMDKRFSNWMVQVAAMSTWGLGCILILAAGLVAEGSSAASSAWMPPLNSSTASPSGDDAVGAINGGAAALGWIGCILAAVGSGVIAPLSTLLVADQIKRPAQRGVAIALYYTSSYSGYLACLLTSHRDMMGSVSGGGSEGAGPLDVPVAASLIASVAMASTVLVVLRNRLVTNKSGGGAQPQWRPWNNLQDTKEDASNSTAPTQLARGVSDVTNDQSRADDEEAGGCSRCLDGMAGLLTASTSGGAGAKQHTAETLALWGLIRIFLVAAVWALLRWQSSAWETQADGLDHIVCLPINGTKPHSPMLNGTSSLGGMTGLGGFGANGSSADGGGGKGGGIPSGCIEIGDVAVQSTGAILGMFMFAMLYMGGFSVIATCASENPVSSVSPLGRMAMGYHVLTVAFFASGMVQLKSDAGCATGSACSSFSVLWQIPQYAMLTLSELLVAIHALEYAYAASAPWQRGTVAAVWYSVQGLAAMIAIAMQSDFARSQLAMHMLAVVAFAVVVSVAHRVLRPTWWSLELLC